MKIEIDTKAKTVRVSSEVNLQELFEALGEMLGPEWVKYSLVTAIVFTPTQQIISPPYTILC